MKIFKTDSWDEKVNFVDINNRLLGYSLSQSCCEDAERFTFETWAELDEKSEGVQ